VYGREERDFGDMDAASQAIRRRVDSGALPWPLLPAGECIRATALGASEYRRAAQREHQLTSRDPASSSRAAICRCCSRPMCARRRSTRQVRPGDPRAFHRLRSGSKARAKWRWPCRWQGAPSYERISAFARHPPRSCHHHRAQEADLSHARWRRRPDAWGILREELLVESEILATTGWCCAISTTSISAASDAVVHRAVTIKSLLFSEDPRRGRPQPAHHHHDHDHGTGIKIIITVMVIMTMIMGITTIVTTY